jgi:uracil-DNA glycosylase
MSKPSDPNENLEVRHQVLIVGEDDPWGNDPRMDLFHLPRHAAGNRLRAHLGLTDAQYVRVRKMNLCPEKWSTKIAREVAKAVMGKPDLRVVIMLGAKVKKAFGCEHIGFFDHTASVDILQRRVEPVLVSLPHPSGRNRLWGQPGARQKAQELLRRICPDIYGIR